MRKLLFVMLAFFAFACDAPNQSSESGAGSTIEESAPVDPAEDETDDGTSINSDTTTSGSMNKPNPEDTVK